MTTLQTDTIAGKVTIEMGPGATITEMIDAFVHLLYCQGYSEDTIAEMLVDCHTVSNYHSSLGIKLLTRGDLADCINGVLPTERAHNEVLDAVFGVEEI